MEQNKAQTIADIRQGWIWQPQFRRIHEDSRAADREAGLLVSRARLVDPKAAVRLRSAGV